MGTIICGDNYFADRQEEAEAACLELLRELRPDVVSVLRKGRIVVSGGPELAEELESTGYAGYEEEAPAGT